MDLIPRKFYLDEFFDDLISKKTDDMKCDIYEKGDKYHIEMDIPGFNKEDISLEVKNNYLTVIAEKDSLEEDEEKNYLRRERRYGKYQRSFYLGELDEENINADFHEGTLNISILKKDESKDKKIIEIK